MKTSLASALRFTIALSIALAVLWTVTRGQDRYTFFDLLAGKKVIAGQLPLPVAQAAQPSATVRPIQAKPIDLNAPEILQQVNDAMSQLAAGVVPSVVTVDTIKRVDVSEMVPVDPFGFFGYQRRDRSYSSPGLGSGVIVSGDGYVLTNHHVIAGVDEIQITTHDGEKFPAEWIGSDQKRDVAVLKIRTEDKRMFPSLALGDSGKVRVGEMVMAIGNPFGLSETVTSGIISAKQRRLSDGENEYFQVDAVINPGNSGGPLVNARGEVIGLNVAIFTGQQDVHVWQGIGLAIPANEAREVYEAIAHGKPLLRGYLGIEVADLSPVIVRRIGLTSGGVLVRQVAEKSPAAVAGIKAGDIVLSFDGRPIQTAEEVLDRIRSKKAGEAAKLEVYRNGTKSVIEATAALQPDSTTLELHSNIVQSGQALVKEMGLAVRNLSAQERGTFNLEATTPAILIQTVTPDSPAARNLRAGDLIHAINRTPVRTVDDFHDLLGKLPQGKPSMMTLSRRGQLFNAYLSPGQ